MAARSDAQLDGGSARRAIGRLLALLHLAQFRLDAPLKLGWQRGERRGEWGRACLDDSFHKRVASGGVEVVEEALAAKAEHLRRTGRPPCRATP